MENKIMDITIKKIKIFQFFFKKIQQNNNNNIKTPTNNIFYEYKIIK